jgi:hypothetical protein
MIFTPSYGGNPIFGLAVHIVQTPGKCAQQLEAFFGVGGMTSLFGGSRGRTFQISGVLADVDLPTLIGDFQIFWPNIPGSIADGVARTLIDTLGQSWLNVVYLGEFRLDPEGPHPFDRGWCVRYEATFYGLS